MHVKLVYVPLFALSMVSWVSVTVTAAGQQCKPTEISVFGMALTSHTFRSVAVTNPFECHALCEKDLKCQSYNFFIPRKICELNNTTKEARPWDYVSDEARFYMGIWKIRDVKSCRELYEVFNGTESLVTTLNLDSTPASVLCHMDNFGCGDGGWTPVMKIDGSKTTFHYHSPLWNNTETFNPRGGETGFDTQETKLPTYWKSSFTKICLGMKIGQQIKFIVVNQQASSLHSLIADGQYRNTSLGRDTWKSLIGDEASLQTFCGKEGFNAMDDVPSFSKARIGIISNNLNNCYKSDSRIGFGTGGYPDDTNTCGNVAKWSPDNGDKYITAIGYILVQ